MSTCRALLALLLAVPAWAQSPAAGAGIRVRTLADSLTGAVGGVAVDRMGTIYVADFGEQVYKIRPDGRVSIFATGLYGASGNTIDADGRLLQSNFSGNYVVRISRDGTVELAAKGFNGPVGVTAAPDGGFWVNNCLGNSISRVAPDGRVTAFANSPLFNCPNGLTRGPDGTLYVANFRDGRVLAVDSAGRVRELAALPGGGNAHLALLQGALYVTSFVGQRIFRVDLDGTVSPVAGTGALGGVDGPGDSATFSFPNGIAAGPTGDRLYVNEFLNRFSPTVERPPVPISRVRQITLPNLAQLMATALGAGGIDSLRKVYRAWKQDPGTGPLYTELAVNALGYQLMAGRQLPAAIVVFELNRDSYPRSFNTWDSLAEAFMNAGRKQEAVTNYRKSLELNPGNTNASEKLRQLGAP